MTEYHEQKWVFEQWLPWFMNQHPEAELCYANANGQYRPGQRMEPGLKAGVPDVTCPVPRGPYHGLYIELKHKRNTPTAQQQWWITRLREQGYRVDVVYEREGMRAALESYFTLPPFGTSVD